jgi:uncharacterized protein YbjQ (UPF0145 family)
MVYIYVCLTKIFKVMELSRTSTTFEIPGYMITRNLGLVRGIIVRSRSIFGTIGAGLQTLVGGNITLLTELCEKTRLDAYTEMMVHADVLGANAVVGIRYESTEIMSGVTEVICYGSAVVVEPKV